MKKYISLWIIITLCTTVLAEHYYYYCGEKVPLNLNADSVTIYMQSNTRQINDPLGSFTFSTIPIDMQEQIPNGINVSSREYVIGDSIITRKMSNCFYIKVKNHADTVALKELVAETHTHWLGQVPHLDRWYKIMVANSILDNSLDMSNYFYETGLFEDVDPGFIFQFSPNCVSDSEFGNQWALPAINACDAWSYTKGDPNLKVAIVDNGIWRNHPEFSNTRFVFSYDCTLIDTTSIGYGIHGTPVAGMIASNHNIGEIAGIAPNVSIMQINHTLNTTQNPDIAEELATGISLAVENGADVINCSWGDQGGLYYEYFHTRTRVLEDALEYALSKGRGGKGCVVVFAAGNTGNAVPNRVDYPASSISKLLVVGSMAQNFIKKDTSSFGKELDVVAPGDMLRVPTKEGYQNGVSGTSIAAPYVSGIAALILSVRPDLTREEVVDIIESTARDDVFSVNYSFKNKPLLRPNGPWCEEVGYGLVDAHAAVSSVANIYIQNQIYKKSVVERAHSIYAGYSVTDTQSYGNVILKSGSDVTYHTTNKVVIKSGFHAEKGSRLHIKADNSFFDPITTAASAPQRIAPRSSSVPVDNTESTDEVATSNSLEIIESTMIQSTAIYTISGQLLQTIDGGQRDAAHLPNGMYILQHRMSDGSTRSEKIANNK